MPSAGGADERSAASDSLRLVLTISTKLAPRNPSRPPTTADEPPPSRAPAGELAVSHISASVPAVPPQTAPIPAEIGTRRPRLERRWREEGDGEGRCGSAAWASGDSPRGLARSRSVASLSRVPMALPATCMATLASSTAAAIQPASPSQPIAAQAMAGTTANQD